MNELITVRVENDKLLVDPSTKPHRNNMALLIPMETGVPYLKHTTEATINTLWTVTTALRPNKTRVPYENRNTGQTDEEIHEDMMVVIKGMSNLMQKMVHSHSYRNGTFEEFDKSEFARQLHYLYRSCGGSNE